MNLHTKVIRHLEQTKNYDFNKMYETNDIALALIYDAVYATEKILREQPLQTSEPLPESKL